MPAQPLPKSNASPDFLTMLLITKYIDGLPLARFEYVLDRYGVKVPRQTLARWVIGAAALLQSLHFTTSIGVASLAEEYTRIDAILNRADRALYAVKNAGRNQVCASQCNG